MNQVSHTSAIKQRKIETGVDSLACKGLTAPVSIFLYGIFIETNKKGNRERLPFLCFIVVSYVTGDLYDKGKRIAN